MSKGVESRELAGEDNTIFNTTTTQQALPAMPAMQPARFGRRSMRRGCVGWVRSLTGVAMHARKHTHAPKYPSAVGGHGACVAAYVVFSACGHVHACRSPALHLVKPHGDQDVAC